MDDLYAVGSSVPDRPPVAITPQIVSAPESLPAAAAKIGITPDAVKEIIPVGDDTDSLTADTVRAMCGYIKAGIADELVQWWAHTAVSRYSRGNREGMPACWAVYWLVKHAIVFKRDEPRLFQTGDSGAMDMLIAPAELCRMQQPTEDCDGFTMLVCALLGCLGIPALIVTVAADPSDPSRWSHVFPVALVAGRSMPLDASHGNAPGWMVPREHIFRWQAWDLDGNKVELAIPPRHATGLHGYTRRGARMRRGMGQDDSASYTYDSDSNSYVPVIGTTATGIDTGLLPLPTQSDTNLISGLATPTLNVPTPGPVASTLSAPINWGQIISSAITGAAKVAQTATLPPGSYYSVNPVTGQQTLVTGGAGVNTSSLLSGSSFGSLLPILGIGLAILLVLGMAGKEGR